MVKIEFSTCNEAFLDGYLEYEASRIISDIAMRVDQGATEGNIRDINGNWVGKWSIKED